MTSCTCFLFSIRKFCFVLSLLLFVAISSFAQSNTYILNGSATRDNCNCYTLTREVTTQSGSVWNANKINLNQPFNFVFNVFLGCQDVTGADGIVFILQPISTSVGSTGGGMGYEGINPSLGIALDTWQNTENNDPAFDHVSIQKNGVINHNFDLVPAVPASAASSNIEDCQWHTFEIRWDPVSKFISVYFDGAPRVAATVDLVATIFNNDPMVYWGFSGGTGGSTNLQRFCTALNPDFNTGLPGNAMCFGAPVTFANTSQSFASIASFYWDFGDGTNSTVANPPPHVYNSPGIYEVKLAITGLDGCQSDTMRKNIVIADAPIAAFDIYDTCSGRIPRIINRSTVQVGNISRWEWTVDGSLVDITQNPQLTGLSPGVHTVELKVISSYGCSSGVVSKQIMILETPVVTASAADGCVDVPVSFNANAGNASITNWSWQFGDNNSGTVQNPVHTYNSTGLYSATVIATANNGCKSEPVTLPVFINEAIANAGNDTMVLNNVPFQLHGSGGTQYLWSPATGLNNNMISSPTATLTDDQTYQLTVTTPEGCTDEDEVTVSVFKGSAIYVPSAFTPNNDGKNEKLIPYYVGIRTLEYFSVYNRWGQLIFTTKDLSAGWNGIFNSVKQQAGVFVWQLKAVDYAGHIYQLKGTSVLLR